MADRINSPGWATYLRVSDEDKQTPERSFAMQRQRIQEHLLTPSDLPFKREYTDVLTGTTTNRVDYQQMLADAESGKFSHLGLYRADRFGRNTVEGLQAATRLIGQGIKIRVAHMPSLKPEEPDGFFMFLIQMGMAQREVDVLKQRTSDGMEAKLRAGGWPNKAPEGYVNKEQQVKSNKYERWVEMEPEQCKVLRQAWDMLLTDRYTLEQICEELTHQGYTRSNGRPWAWVDQKKGRRFTAKNRLQEIFHNPFYAGWIVSERFGIAYGEINGKWEPIVSTSEYERGIEILHKHDAQKSRERRQFYLLRTLLWVQAEGEQYKMFGSTPSGRSKSYSYYITHVELQGRKIHFPSESINGQILGWLRGITIPLEQLPRIREVYQDQIKRITHNDYGSKVVELRRKLAQLHEEESRLGRLFMTHKISEETYQQLREEWQGKVRHAEASLRDLQQNINRFLDDLDLALILMTKLPELFERLEEQNKVKLLQILVRRIIVNPQGEIIDYELHSPFMYLREIVDDLESPNSEESGSNQVRLRSP